jgi:tetratricopeptide (TPR) repeat protein
MADPQGLLELSRRAHWTFPSSAGPPLREGDDEPWAGELLAARSELIEAARVLDRDAAVELGANAWRVWMLARDPAGGREFLTAALGGEGGHPRDRALALYGDGLFAFWSGAFNESRRQGEDALSAARESGDAEALSLAHLGLCRLAFGAQDYEGARYLAREALRHAEGLTPAMSQGPTHALAQSTRFMGDLDEAAALLYRSLELNRQIDDAGMVGVELHNLAYVELHRGDFDTARRLFGELASRVTADDPFTAVMIRMNEAAVALTSEDREGAASLLASVDAMLEESGIELPPDDQYELQWLRAQT